MPLMRKSYVVAQLESTKGEDAQPTAADILPITQIGSYTPYDGNTQSRERMRPYLGAVEQVNVSPRASIQLTFPLYGAGTAGEVPFVGRVLRACGMAETVVPAADDGATGALVKYTPTSADSETLTLWFERDGRLQRLTGAVGAPTLDLSTEGFPTLQVTFTGAYNRPEVSPLEGVSFEESLTEIPVNNQNTPKFAVHGQDEVMQSLSVDFGNNVAWKNLVGYEGADRTDRQPSGQVNIRARGAEESLAYFEMMESHRQVKTGSLEIVHGVNEGNIIEFRAPQAQLSSISDQDSDGRLHYQFDLSLLPEKGDDEFELIFR
ncbi:hypothetical protein BFW38_03365 [Terasakiispira papahanaumokuakeensis]|uniref:Phage tail protein n=1 Tax=Terasakiispira papahanaumokuakeensis TaxID=197479 RepID=A0A1E2V6W7_9GAMM|nr:phage tail tube protein [Terasakiispira papahanaumokuakeensis]ODC02727.1 hypothetical protein BFW38_03365 [Terasakiispira papahanaumokuakeensis]